MIIGANKCVGILFKLNGRNNESLGGKFLLQSVLEEEGFNLRLIAMTLAHVRTLDNFWHIVLMSTIYL